MDRWYIDKSEHDTTYTFHDDKYIHLNMNFNHNGFFTVSWNFSGFFEHMIFDSLSAAKNFAKELRYKFLITIPEN